MGACYRGSASVVVPGGTDSRWVSALSRGADGVLKKFFSLAVLVFLAEIDRQKFGSIEASRIHEPGRTLPDLQ